MHPEDVTLFAPSPAAEAPSARNVLPVTVRRSALAAACGWSCWTGTGQPLQALVTRAAADELGLAEGMGLYAVVKAAAVHVTPRAGHLRGPLRHDGSG